MEAQPAQKYGEQERAAFQIAAGLPIPVLLVGPGQQILFVNPAAEQFFGMGAGLLIRHGLSDIVPFRARSSN